MKEVDCLVEELERFENKPFDIQNNLNTSVSNVICSLVFGKRFHYKYAKFKLLIILLNKLFLTASAFSPATIFPLLRHLPMFNVDTVRYIIGEVDVFTKEIIEEHRRNFDESNMNDFIYAFLLEETKVGIKVSTFTGNEGLAVEKKCLKPLGMIVVNF